jgi:hypothetical protein
MGRLYSRRDSAGLQRRCWMPAADIATCTPYIGGYAQHAIQTIGGNQTPVHVRICRGDRSAGTCPCHQPASKTTFAMRFRSVLRPSMRDGELGENAFAARRASPSAAARTTSSLCYAALMASASFLAGVCGIPHSYGTARPPRLSIAKFPPAQASVFGFITWNHSGGIAASTNIPG